MKRLLFYLVIPFILFIISGCSDNSPGITQPPDHQTLEKVIITCFTGSEVLDEILDPGTIEHRGDKLYIRNRVFTSNLITNSNLMTGSATLHHNAVFDLRKGEGFAHGTIVIVPDNAEGGRWEGNYHGKISKTAAEQWTSHSQLVASGRGGIINHMQMYYFNTIVTVGLPATSWSASGEGCIKQDGVNKKDL